MIAHRHDAIHTFAAVTPPEVEIHLLSDPRDKGQIHRAEGRTRPRINQINFEGGSEGHCGVKKRRWRSNAQVQSRELPIESERSERSIAALVSCNAR